MFNFEHLSSIFAAVAIWCQFHQHFTRTFFVQNFGEHCFCMTFWHQKHAFVQKMSVKNVDEIDTC